MTDVMKVLPPFVDHEAIWSIEIRKRRPAGQCVFGEETIVGIGSTPEEALAHAHLLLSAKASDIRRDEECLLKEESTR